MKHSAWYVKNFSVMDLFECNDNRDFEMLDCLWEDFSRLDRLIEVKRLCRLLLPKASKPRQIYLEGIMQYCHVLIQRNHHWKHRFYNYLAKGHILSAFRVMTVMAGATREFMMTNKLAQHVDY